MAARSINMADEAPGTSVYTESLPWGFQSFLDSGATFAIRGFTRSGTCPSSPSGIGQSRLGHSNSIRQSETHTVTADGDCSASCLCDCTITSVKVIESCVTEKPLESSVSIILLDLDVCEYPPCHWIAPILPVHYQAVIHLHTWKTVIHQGSVSQWVWMLVHLA